MPKFTSEISYRFISLSKNKLVSDRVEYCIANTVFKYWNGIVPGYIHEMFKPSLCRYSTRSQMALDIPLRKAKTGQKCLSLLGPKYGQKSPLVSKMLEHRLLLCMLSRKIFYFIYKTNSSYYYLLMIDIIIWFFHSNIISSCHHWYPFKSFVIF